MSISQLLELHDLAKQESRKYDGKRFLFPQLMHGKGRHFIGIVGARGTGKTVLLRQYALKHNDAFYLSADTLDQDDDAWGLIRKLNQQYGFRTFLLDEVHFLPDPTALLKRLYDFVDVHILFSSSVALAMRASAHDLSRRVRLINLHGFSFREFLTFTQGICLPPLELEQIAAGKWAPDHLRAGRFFDDYLQGGILPFSLEEPEPLGFLESIIEKVITRDIPSVVRLVVDELESIRRLLRFVGRSAVDGINYSSLSRNLGITKYKAEQYVGCLERAFILHQVFPAGTNVLREPKVLMTPPVRLLYRDVEDAVGGLREDFFVEAMKQAGIQFQYLKSTRGAKTPDYLVEDAPTRLAVEIGGPGKGREQFKGVQIDRKLVFAHSPAPEKGRLPLFLLGYLS
ncbi:MAG: AAA family ATPase [Thermodesulfobacteriota bacterium]|nr:AAA family ATPase [Thermodesulfobacteriota bacterium]